MSTIEHVVETPPRIPDYSGREFTPKDIKRGKHRAYIGGRWGWDENGQNQLDFLIGQGLKPGHTFLDVGCGCFRAGRFLVDYLEPEHYYGIDANLGVMQAGYDYELSDAQRAKLPTTNLRANDRFLCEFGETRFDYAIAQSVFTHVSLNHIRLCLARLAQSMNPGGKFYATFFEQPPGTRLDILDPRGRYVFPERNPYWYYRKDMRWAAESSPWTFRYIGNWGHSHRQMMIEFTRTDDEVGPAARRANAPGASLAGKVIRRGRKSLARRIAP